MATAAPSTVWASVLEEEVPSVICNSIVDERRLCATGKEAPKQLKSAIQVTSDFDGATGTLFNPMKSTCATIQFTQINVCDASQVDGEGSATNRGTRNKLDTWSRTKAMETERTRTRRRMKRRGLWQELRA